MELEYVKVISAWVATSCRARAKNSSCMLAGVAVTKLSHLELTSIGIRRDPFNSHRMQLRHLLPSD